MKILLVDDEEENLYLLEKLLQGNGYETLSAANGAEALTAALKNPPDMVVSDILMPVMDGFTLCREWRKNKILKKIPFVFYTATYTSLKDEEFALSLGADSFIVKPKGPDYFLQIIKEIFKAFKDKEMKPKPEHIPEEKVFLKEYNKTLVRKLEDKMTQLEAVEKELREKNEALQKDIIERKLAEEELALINRAFNSVMECISITDSDNNIIFVNQAFLDTYEYTKSELIGKSIYTVRANFPPVKDTVLKETLSGGWQGELLNRKKDGTIFPVSLSTSIVYNEKKQPIGLVGIASDITERKKAEEAIHLSEEKFKTLFMSMNEGFYLSEIIYDKEGNPCDYRYLEVNKKFEQIMGLSREQIIGKRYKELVPVNTTQWLDIYCKVARTGKPMSYQFYSNEYQMYFETYSYKQAKDQVAVFVSDITERVRAEQRVNQLATIVQYSEDAIIGKTLDGIVTSWNSGAEKIYGYLEIEMVGKSISKLIPAGKEDELQQILKKIKSGEYVRHYETLRRRKDGKEIHVSITVSPIRDAEGKIVAASTIGRDITERKRAEEALKESESRFRNIIENSKDGIIFFDQKTRRILFGNNAMAGLLGCSKEDLIGRSIQSLHPAEEWTSIEKEFQKHVRGEISFSTEIPVLCNDGSIFYTDISSNLLTLEGRSYFSAFFRDITERKRTEEAIRESEEKFRMIFENAFDGISIYDENPDPSKRRLIDCNERYAAMAGRTREELLKLGNAKAFQKPLEGSGNQASLGSISASTSYRGSFSWIRPDGKDNIIEYVAVPVIWRGKPYSIGIDHDITEQKRLQSQFLQAQKMESIGTLAGGIAHDFNNILGIILGYTTIMEQRTLSPEKFRESLGIINSAVGRGAALVRQILTFARKTDVVFESVNIIELIHELLSMFRQTFPRIITLIDDVDKGLPFINADRIQIHQVLLNLCVNSRDAMPKGGLLTLKAEKQTKEKVQKRISAADKDSYVCVSVTDTGEGMDEATRSQIFDPFFTTKELGKGTGLGLAVVYGVMQSHHGLIDVESVLGHGTTFRLYFPIPLASELQPDASLLTESFIKGGTETVLLIEDEEALLEVVCQLLESKGYKVYTAQDGNDAIKMYKQHKQEIAIVLTDMGLPGMTGIDVHRKLREINPNVNVIFASGYFEPHIKSELYKIGAKGFIQKPYSPDEVLRILREVLDKK